MCFLPGDVGFSLCRRFLDCRTLPTQSDFVDVHSNISNVHYYTTQDVSLVNHKDTQFVAICFNGGISCFNETFNKVLWSIKGAVGGTDQEMNPYGIATDDKGHVFISDNANSCIHMFTTNGTYIDTILRREEAEMGQIVKVKWCRATQSLVVAHCIEEKIHLTALQLTLD